MTNTPPRVHVLGLGSIGSLVAHSLAEIPRRPPVTLLLHRLSLLEGYRRNECKLGLQTTDGKFVSHGGYDFEVLHNKGWHHASLNSDHSIDPITGQPNGIATGTIEHLIVCVKATQTVAALQSLGSRLNQNSTVMFLQNGAGMIEDVNKHLFQDPKLRPNYITGVISHGVTMNKPFDITHTGFAATSIGPVPRNEPSKSDPSKPTTSNSSSYLLDALPQVPRFKCRSYDWSSIFQIQLEKLSVNAFCNPLCALADSQNKYLFTIPDICRSLMREISSVVLAMPEFQGAPGVRQRFSPEVLEQTVMGIIERTRETTCSMVWDLRAGRETEIAYINGYWCRRGRELGVPTPINDELVARIEMRTKKSE
ncbi:putative 2-dehydropantoate 2-reductase family protein [Aaosphaeria arxii CBS 175.79]|uniref:2-dehydropantoate 2-reductase n=1 Tax=Aaosphaeria arxii CBS 175.79 TaxID=1450172 RepID=A0A6A5Y010_9PLEO|nr:putative 2-dehydropantoate 2-reductase family protein [Aaosphaeria arxii CBS 175.79]KAF2018589.1 putative 2-dehydropantoate 2-reductase family protein [Aaosphaeria arxii CBS 175.79]